MNRLLLPLFLITLCSCSPYRYINIETYNPASITFPVNMRRILIVNNALPQNDVPFESIFRQQPESFVISADSAAFDFCSTFGEVLTDFHGFDDVRLLDGCLRKDMSPLSIMNLNRSEVELLCDEHETDVVISLDRLLYRIDNHFDNIYGFQTQEEIHVEISGVLNVYVPGRDSPMTTIALTDTVIIEIGFDFYNEDFWDIFFSNDQSNLLRVAAKYLTNEARMHFIPYWNEDSRWYYTSFDARWKRATAYAQSDMWDKAMNIWKDLYGQTTSWKKNAYLCSNLALAMELTGDLVQALQYAELSYQLMHDHWGAENAITKKQEVYLNVLKSRIVEEQKLRLQMEE